MPRAATLPDDPGNRVITEKLAVNVLGWKAAKGRFLRADKSWIASWRFAPLTNLNDAFDLLEAANSNYTLRTNTTGTFEAEVRIGKRMGRACGKPKARTITLALANALGFDDIRSGPEPEKLANGNHLRRGRGGL